MDIKMKGKPMFVDNGYKYMVGNRFERIKIALTNEDYGYAADLLQRIKINRSQYVELCHIAIERRKTSTLEFLLDSYSVFWNQDLFNELSQYVVSEHAFEFIPFISKYIDRVNEYNDNINKWNEYVIDKQKQKELLEKQKTEKPVNIFQKILKFLPKIKK